MSVVELDDASDVAAEDVPALEAIGLSKRFGTLLALGDVSLRLARGSVHALLGENGAGKSTLVKCIMGYQPADTGRVLGEDHSLTSTVRGNLRVATGACPLDAPRGRQVNVGRSGRSDR